MIPHSYWKRPKLGPFLGIRQLNPGAHSGRRVYDTSGIAPALRSSSGGWGAKTGLYAVPVHPRKAGSGCNGRIVKPDGSPSFAVLTRPPGVYDGHHIRMFTPLECERLQGFPDHWTDVDGMSDTQRYMQLGNAVPPPMVEFVLRRLAP